MSPLRNKRILMTADTVGGVWTYATSLASALSATSGVEVYLVTMGPPPRASQRALLSTSAVHLIETDLALEWQDPNGDDIARACEFFGTLERQIEPDLIHLNSYREATFNWRAPVIVVAHSCVNSWALACNDNSFLSEPQWRTYSKWVAEGLDRADRWVSPTRSFAETMVNLHRPCTDGVIVWNGVATAPNVPEPKRHFILAAGRMWDAAKNLKVLVQGAKNLDWPVFVAGPVGESQKPAAGVALVGELSRAELGERMQQAAVFVSPAYYEPFGLSVLEAASNGCALVLSDIPTFRELWNGAALFVAPDDPSALQTALNELCNNSSKRSALQRAALTRARRYSIRSMINSYVQLYGSLLSGAAMATRTILEVPA